MSARRAGAPIGLLLAPGAGANRDTPALVAIDAAATAAGLTAIRMDFPYRKAGRKAPDREPVLIAAVREETVQLASRVSASVLGGRSMGGRMCSIAVADGLPAAGLLLISYPLHPPGRPDRERTEHFPRLQVPCCFISGTRDAFGTPEELQAATRAISGPVTHRWIDGKDHALRGVDQTVAEMALEWIGALPPAGAGS